MDFEKIKSVEQIYIVLLFLTPGLLIVYFRSMFVTGRRPKTSEYVIEYIILSTAYLAATLPSKSFWGIVAAPGFRHFFG